jgi:predicted XRE-type DNA-binding protein
MTKKKFDTVWDAIADTPQEAASMKIRADLMLALQEWLSNQNCTQADAATFFGVTQPRVSDLTRGRISLFSTDSLLDMAATAGLRPTLTVRTTTKKSPVLTKRTRKAIAIAA